MAQKTYRPSASYTELKRVEKLIRQVQTVEDVRQLVRIEGPKIGYKAFCYLLSERMTPELMKPDESSAYLSEIEQESNKQKPGIDDNEASSSYFEQSITETKTVDETDIMSDLYDWNQAIYQYITAGLPSGSRVFLSIDDAALVSAGRLLDQIPLPSERVNIFLRAVRARYVVGSRIHNITPLGDEANKVPGYLSFLAATVLAAYRMAEGEEISQTNYFTRLNEVFGFPGKQGRISGLDTGIEENLWEHWANWLIRRGYRPSAEAGKGSRKFVNYPISQTLLRQADREALWRFFTNRNWSRSLDEDVVVARALREQQYFSNHLRNLLSDQSMGAARRQGLYQTIFEVYDLWANSGAGSQGDYQQVISAGHTRNLAAGLYRTFDRFGGEPEYALFPRQIRRLQVERAQVTYQGQTCPLTSIRPGWYQPFGDISASDLDHGLKLDINGTDELDKLVLPRRDFWILTRDPDDPYSGIYGSWGKPAIGVPFIILCKPDMQTQLELLREQGLIQWRVEPVNAWEGKTWLEFEDVMVVSDGWGTVLFDNDDLLESLQPGKSIGISLSGGLRTGQSGWLTNHGPTIIINTFHKRADVTIIDPISEEELQGYQDVKTNEPFHPDWPSQPGNYLLRVDVGSREAERFVTLGDWDNLAPAVVDDFPRIPLAEGSISGVLVEEVLYDC